MIVLNYNCCMGRNKLNNSVVEAMAQYMAYIQNDPILFVMTGFNHRDGFEILPWQRDVLGAVQSGIMSVGQAARVAVSSGHGIGKSALVSWLILWSLCKQYTRGIVTANTEAQLTTKTWSELTTWYNKWVLKDCFDRTATSIYSNIGDYDKVWRVDAITWNENKPESFAGLHNYGNRILVIFDEGSAIPDSIYDVVEGAMTDKDTEKIFCVFGNPTRPVGRFREFFSKLSKKWETRVIDSRNVSITDKEQIQEWAQTRGEDSDFFRIRVRGLFPLSSNENFIGEGLVDEAMKRLIDVQSYSYMPRVIGVDVARFGLDDTAICRRQGRKMFPIITYSGLDLMQVADAVVKVIESFNPVKVFIDGTGLGAGVVDKLVEMGYGRLVVEVNFSNKSYDERYSNKRAEMWGEMRDWLATGSIDFDEELKQDLISPTYNFNGKCQIVLESKKDMKKRNIDSPDKADSLALTFAEPVKQSVNSIDIKLR